MRRAQPCSVGSHFSGRKELTGRKTIGRAPSGQEEAGCSAGVGERRNRTETS